MSQVELDFTGFVSNVDSSILQVKLNHGFIIDSLLEKEGFDVLALLEGAENLVPFTVAQWEFQSRIAFEAHCLNLSERRFFVIRNSFSCPVGSNPLDYSNIVNETSKFHVSHVQNYLEPTLRLMRLFKEGDIRMPMCYYCIMDNGKPKLRRKHFKGQHVSGELFSIVGEELSDLNSFISNTRLPFSSTHLQLAFENFELSYETPNPCSSFLALMSALETLLNPGESEVRYRIGRNLSVLLGKDRNDSSRIFSEFQSLYQVRSKILHSGRLDSLSTEDLPRLRHYVRASIIEICRLGRNKDEILDLLNTHGFGERIPLKQ